MEVDHVCDIEIFHGLEASRLRLCGTLLLCPSNYRSLEVEGTTNYLGCFLHGSDASSFAINFRLDQWFDSSFEEHIHRRTEMSGTSCTDEEYEAAHDKQRKALLGSVLIMPILCYVKSTEDEENPQLGNVMGLLLHQSPGTDRGYIDEWVS